jgi:protein involved in polysaccharide export with SLBB domain
MTHGLSRGIESTLISVMIVLLSMTALSAPAASAQTRESRQPSDTGSSLRPGDIVRLRIWREPDLSGDFPVSESGQIVFPKIGPTNVTDVSADSLKRLLVSSYSAYLRDPSIEVTLLRRITILGAVRNPGLYPVDMTMTVSDAMALAGGAAPDGRANRVELRRAGEKVKIDLSAQTRLGDTPVRSGDQLYFPQRSWISRNPGVVAGTLTALTGLVVSLLIRR